MSPVPYHVSQSGIVSDQFRAALVRADAEQKVDEVAATAATIHAALTWVPEALGESRDFLPYAQLDMRIAFQGPLYVIFGIHQPSRTVFIKRIAWSRRS